jgi:hypothetical protein
MACVTTKRRGGMTVRRIRATSGRTFKAWKAMSVQYFAKVKSPEDHAAFQRIVKHYPSCTYEEWLFREQKKMSDWKSRRHAIKLVEITPAEFEAYCKKTGKPSDLTTFLKAVTDKAF